MPGGKKTPMGGKGKPKHSAHSQRRRKKAKKKDHWASRQNEKSVPVNAFSKRNPRWGKSRIEQQHPNETKGKGGKGKTKDDAPVRLRQGQKTVKTLSAHLPSSNGKKRPETSSSKWRKGKGDSEPPSARPRGERGVAPRSFSVAFLWKGASTFSQPPEGRKKRGEKDRLDFRVVTKRGHPSHWPFLFGLFPRKKPGVTKRGGA